MLALVFQVATSYIDSVTGAWVRRMNVQCTQTYLA